MRQKLAFNITASAALVFVMATGVFSQGGKIAFQSCSDGNCEIYLINPDGTGEVRLTFNSGYDAEPSVSANGTKIAFVSARDGQHDEIYSMNLDGSNQTRLTDNF